MIFGTLCTGVGGIDLGLERAGMSCAYQVEIDPYARRVLERHWPSVARWRDVHHVRGEVLPAVDLVAFGFPCQDLSVAGKGAGLDGSRSGLWWECLRVVRETRPRWLLVENVRGLLAHLGEVLGPLAESGYDLEWDCIPAVAAGAPHRRDRVFVVGRCAADPDGSHVRIHEQRQPEGRPAHQVRDRGHAVARDAGAVGPAADTDRERWEGLGREGAASRPAIRSDRGARCAPADADGGRLSEQPARDDGPRARELREPRRHDAGRRGALDGGQALAPLRRVDDGLSFWLDRSAQPPATTRERHARVDRLRCLGNAVVPQVAEWIGRRILAADLPW